MNSVYEKALKKRAIQQFVADNGRSPNQPELRELLKQWRERYPTIDVVGFSGFDTTKPQFKDESSAEAENSNRDAFITDLNVAAERLQDLADELEDSFRAFDASARRTMKLLGEVESRVDNLLLLNSSVDVFVYGVEETFSTHTLIDLEDSTAEVESGFVTLGRDGYTVIDLEGVKLDVNMISAKGILGYQATNKADSLKYNDGSIWEAIANTSYRTGRVTLQLTMTLDEPQYVSDIRITARPVDGTKRSSLTVMYSLDGATWVVSKPAEQEFYSGENQVNIGKDGVRAVRVLISKEGADDQTTSANQFSYIFSLDSVVLYGDTYSSELESVLYCGPYEVVDELGEPVYFTKAKIDCCAVIPEGTGLSFFLSQDGTSYQSASTNGNSLDVVSFGSSDMAGTYDLVDDTLDTGALVDQTPSGLGLSWGTESFLNLYIPAGDADTVAQKSIEVRRNMPNGATIYGTTSGWSHDPSTKHYKTTIYVEEEEGKSINLGSSTALINGRLQSGQVKIQKGYTTFETNDSNWFAVDETVTSVDELRAIDPIYPYNHKYLVEGFPYSADWEGEEIYYGMDVYFGTLLRYVSPEMFNGTKDDLTIYTIEERDGDLYFKVKVNKTDASWASETFEIKYLVQTSDTNNLYVKVLLQTTSAALTPKLDSFKVRVI